MISKETLEHLLTYINDIDSRYEDILGKKITESDRILANLLSLTEETGELTEQIKIKLGLGFSKIKRENYKEENLEDETVDVLICFLMLIKSVGIENLDGIIERKIGINNKRGY